jgi:hypothetical protein
MKTSTTLAALAVALLSGLAFAQERVEHQPATICMPGTVWDPEKRTCVDIPTS